MADLLITVPSRRRLAVMAGSVLVATVLGLVLGTGGAGSQTPPAAPTITSVTPGDGALTVAWSAPAGVTGITRYDVRHIRSDADAADKLDDAKWTVELSVWSSGDPLEYTIGGLAGRISYDVQARAVNADGVGVWSATVTGTPRDAPPAITRVLEGDEALTVYWQVPLGVDEADITAYHLRYIESDATDKADANWNDIDDAWTPDDESRRYLLTGLSNDTSYDVQLRAVTSTTGGWSATSTGTPADPGATRLAATTLPPDTHIGGVIESGTDVDYFEITLPRATGLIVTTRGDLDTVGELQTSSGVALVSGDDSNVSHGGWNFLIWQTLGAGTYYIEVTSFAEATGAYVLEAITIADTTGTADAALLALDTFRNGLIDPRGDQDYFTFTLDAQTDLMIRSAGAFDTVGELRDDEGNLVAYNDDGHLSGFNFLIRAQLDAGTYYVRVSGYSSRIRTNTGVYSLHLESVTEPGSTRNTAATLGFGRAQGGRIDPSSDVDYFRIDATEDKWVLLRAVSESVETTAELLDSGGNAVRANLYEWDAEDDDDEEVAWGFTLQDRLSVGTHYIKVTRDGAGLSTTGPYTISLLEDFSYPRFLSDCSDITTTFSDPLYGCQWHLNNSGQLGGTDGEDINVEDAWATTQGAGINVAVVDNGMDYEHEDLTDNVMTTKNHNYNTDGTDIFDARYSHGTSVAGVIAARDNTVGVRGVAPQAGIYGYNLLRAFTEVNRGDAMTRKMGITAVSNNSWGWLDGPGLDAASAFWEMAVERGITTGYGGKGVFYAWAAGNGALGGDDSNLDGFANHYGVTAVCAVNDHGERSAYSEKGANLWVCGPSNDFGEEGITTTANVDRYTDSFGGTSSAAPAVSGVAALVRATNNDLTWRDVKLILAASARKNDATNSSWRQGALKYGSDTDRYQSSHEYGFGVVDAKAAVDLAADWDLLRTLVEETGHFDRDGGDDPRQPQACIEQHHHGFGRGVHRVRRDQRHLQRPQLQGAGAGTGIPVGYGLHSVPFSPEAGCARLQTRRRLRAGGQLPLRLGQASGRGPRRHVNAARDRQSIGGHGFGTQLLAPHRLRPQHAVGGPPYRLRHPRGFCAGRRVGRADRYRRVRHHRLRRATHRCRVDRRREGYRCQLDPPGQRLDLGRPQIHDQRPGRGNGVRRAGKGGDHRRWRRALVCHGRRQARFRKPSAQLRRR